LVALEDTKEGEGFFVCRGTHITSPDSFLRKVYCVSPIETASKDMRTSNTLNKKCVMFNQKKSEKEQELKMERVALHKGDVVAYHGNLSYYLDCPSASDLLFLHLVEGRGVKWDNDNM